MNSSLKVVAVASFVLALSAGAAELDWNRRNSEAAASCSRLFFAAGDLDEAEFFADLSRDEQHWNVEAKLARIPLLIPAGHRMEFELEWIRRRHPDRAPEAAREVLRGAATRFAAKPDIQHLGLLLRSVIELDPSLRDQVTDWVYEVIRAELCPANANQLRWLLAAIAPRSEVDREEMKVIRVPAPQIVEIHREIAHRAAVLGYPDIAGFFAGDAIQFADGARPGLLRILVQSALRLSSTDPVLAEHFLTMAVRREPSLLEIDDVAWLYLTIPRCNAEFRFANLLESLEPKLRRGARIRSPEQIARSLPPQTISRTSRTNFPSPDLYCPPLRQPGWCPVGEVPEWYRNSTATEKIFPEQSWSPPVEPPSLPADFRIRARACRSLAPPLFPEPFEKVPRKIEDKGATEYRRGEGVPRERCLSSISWETVVDSEGNVAEIRLRHARFRGEGGSLDQALEMAERVIVPVLKQEKYEPARIRGVPVWSVYSAGASVRCW